MKLLQLLLITLFIIGCSSKEVSVYEETKLIKINCSFCENVLNTFDNTYSQVAYGNTNTIPFYLSIEEQSEIIAQIENMDFFKLPDTLKTPHTSQFETLEDIIYYSGQCPEKQFCEIEMNGKMKGISWDGWLSYEGVKEYALMQKLLKTVGEILHNRSEVKQLPIQFIY